MGKICFGIFLTFFVFRISLQKVRTRRDDEITCTNSTVDQFLHLQDMTCKDCPEECSSCLNATSNFNFPCTSCNDGHKLIPWNDGDGAECVACSSLKLVVPSKTTQLRLASPVHLGNPVLSGRLEVVHGGQWYGVCDDGWDMASTGSACKEMKLGTGVEYYHSYDQLNPGLPAIRIAYDDVQCKESDDTFFQCDKSGFLTHDCAATETVGIRCSGVEEQESCLEQCPSGQYEDLYTSICTVCSEKCKLCSESADFCLSCVTPYFLHNAICRSSCEDGFYGNTTSRQCNRCSVVCSKCADGVGDDHCLSCPDGHILHDEKCLVSCPENMFQIQAEDLVKKCVAGCPSSHFIKSGSCLPCSVDCKTCSGSSTNCSSCQTNTYLFNAFCRAECPSGSFPSSLGVCQMCRYKNCLQCLPGGDYCTSCIEGYVLEKLMCKRKCSSGLFTHNDECMAHCPDGYHQDFASETCVACNSMCKTCAGPGHACLTCFDGFFLKGAMCVRDCGDGLVAVDLTPANQAVRIVGSIATDGRVEILNEGVWSAICSPSWSVNEATVVCRNLHFGKPLLSGISSNYGEAVVTSYIDFECGESEVSLDACEQTIVSKDACNGQVVIIHCSGRDETASSSCYALLNDSCSSGIGCYPGVTCTDLPGQQLGYCGPCPPMMHGNGIHCEKDAAKDQLLEWFFPKVTKTQIKNWPDGSELLLSCSLKNSNDELVAMTWTKGGVLLTSSADWRIEHPSTLRIFHPKGSKFSGIYKCKKTTDMTVYERSFNVTVYQNAQITVPPFNQKGSINLKLKCSFVGYPKPTVSWYKDGTQLNFEELQDKMTMLTNGTLLIKYGTAVDNGQYMCIVRNDQSMDSASALVIITGDPKIINQIKSIPAIEGQNVTINCIAGGAPTPQVIWKLDGEALGNITGKREVFSNGTLKIMSVTRNDRATYTCVATNDQGVSAVWQPELLIVEIPKVVISPTSATVMVGDAIEFQCDVNGNPPPKISWSVPSRGTFSKTNVAKGIDIKGNRMTIAEVVGPDSGHVFCLGINSVAIVNASAELTIQVPPRFIKEPSDTTVLAGWPATLSWEMYGNPAPVVYWYKGERIIEDHQTDVIKVDAESLVFIPRTPKDSANYKVQAVNIYGSITGEGYVKVLPLLLPFKFTRIRENNVTLKMSRTWKALKGHPEAMLVIWVTQVSSTNGSRLHMGQNPLELSGFVLPGGVKPQVHAVVEKDTPEVVIGDDTNYTNPFTMEVVLNSALQNNTWYDIIAVAYIPRNGTIDEELITLGATEYITVFTEYKNDDKTIILWPIAIVFFLILISAIVGLTVYLHRKGRLRPLLVRLNPLNQWWKSSGKLNHGEGPIDVEAFLEQFTAPGYANQGFTSEVTSKQALPASSAYIPTEDEIEAMENMGIHYYEDEKWFENVPQGVIGISEDDIARMRSELLAVPSTSTEPPAEHRTSLPLMRSPSEPKSLHTSESEPSNMARNSSLTSKRKNGKSSENEYVIQGELSQIPSLMMGLAAPPLPKRPANISRPSSFSTADRQCKPLHRVKSSEDTENNSEAKQTDSGFESETKKIPPTRPPPPMNLFDRKVQIFSQPSSDSSGSRTGDISTKDKWKDKKKKKPKGRKMARLKERSLKLLSRMNKRWSMHFSNEDEYVADGESENDVVERVNPLPMAFSSSLADTDDPESEYIDPSLIMSFPVATHRLLELQEHNTDTKKQSNSRFRKAAKKIIQAYRKKKVEEMLEEMQRRVVVLDGIHEGELSGGKEEVGMEEEEAIHLNCHEKEVATPEEKEVDQFTECKVSDLSAQPLPPEQWETVPNVEMDKTKEDQPAASSPVVKNKSYESLNDLIENEGKAEKEEDRVYLSLMEIVKEEERNCEACDETHLTIFEWKRPEPPPLPINTNASRPLPPLPSDAAAPAPALPQRDDVPPEAPPRRNKRSQPSSEEARLPLYENVGTDSHNSPSDANDTSNGNIQMNQLTTILSQMAENMAATFAVVTSAMNMNAVSTQKSEFGETMLTPTQAIGSQENTEHSPSRLSIEANNEEEISEGRLPCSSRRTSIVQLFPPVGSLSRRGSLLVPPFNEPIEVDGSSDGSPALSCSLSPKAASRRSSIQPDVMIITNSEVLSGESSIPLHHNAPEPVRVDGGDHNGPSVDVSVKPFSSSAENPKPKKLKIPGIFQSI